MSFKVLLVANMGQHEAGSWSEATTSLGTMGIGSVHDLCPIRPEITHRIRRYAREKTRLGIPVLYYNHKPTLGHHDVDESDTPLFPFGHGLSHTHFDYTTLRVSPAAMAPGALAEVHVHVRNTGPVEGTEMHSVVAPGTFRIMVGGSSSDIRLTDSLEVKNIKK